MMSESNNDYSEILAMACAFTCIAAKRKGADAKRPPSRRTYTYSVLGGEGLRFIISSSHDRTLR